MMYMMTFALQCHRNAFPSVYDSRTRLSSLSFPLFLNKSILITYVIVQLTVIIIMYAIVPVTEGVIETVLKQTLINCE